MEAVASTLQTSVSQAAHASHEIAASIEHILHFNDLPQWMQIDPYIQQGYRRQLDSFRACFWSLFYTHNELVNTWSHLLPAFFYLALLLATDYSIFLGGAKVSTPDNLAFQTYVAGTAGCLLLSAFFHATNAHSEDVVRRFLKLDYLGITLSISVTCISSTYFGLYGDPTLQALYITMTVICASAVFRAVLDPEMDGPAAAGWRAVLFIALAGSGFTPVGHKAVTDGVDSLQGFPLFSLMLMSLSYLVGTVIYITHVPEKYWPGRFDIWVSVPC
ncbi:Hly-III-related [Lasallia pustulata]|uniref:Hly-III-related n=1 Tax=Lasallia pustulata TaxID=136370 RepID=A0A1W5D550_9LECA|nr:Hly-III-related [Lasallia pustulata]